MTSMAITDNICRLPLLSRVVTERGSQKDLPCEIKLMTFLASTIVLDHKLYMKKLFIVPENKSDLRKSICYIPSGRLHLLG